ncbi:hypothetical protein [Paraburkholderia sp. J8-2]|uniref:hypothetical protein n=1 Tax=Paraburkholderia sp. J8-2 TaxID=2805440 RepID=UPI002AB7240B|nr:hypothetical protein [Paraburkholderia sp. J8-2]
MTLKIQGSILVECAGERLSIQGAQFGLEEDGTRNLGDGDFQYEALHIYFDPEDRFKILVESTLLQGSVTIYPAKVEEGSAVIVEDNLDAVEG